MSADCLSPGAGGLEMTTRLCKMRPRSRDLVRRRRHSPMLLPRPALDRLAQLWMVFGNDVRLPGLTRLHDDPRNVPHDAPYDIGVVHIDQRDIEASAQGTTIANAVVTFAAKHFGDCLCRRVFRTV